MGQVLFQDLSWWITAIEVPVLAALFGLIWSTTRDVMHLREELAAFKLTVAQTYTPGTQVRELELRLTSHLLRIEAKLDTTALKTEGLFAEQRSPHDRP